MKAALDIAAPGKTSGVPNVREHGQSCKAEEAKENGGSHSLESDRQKEGCGTILWRNFIQLRCQRGDNQQAKGQRNYDSDNRS